MSRESVRVRTDCPNCGSDLRVDVEFDVSVVCSVEEPRGQKVSPPDGSNYSPRIPAALLGRVTPCTVRGEPGLVNGRALLMRPLASVRGRVQGADCEPQDLGAEGTNLGNDIDAATTRLCLGIESGGNVSLDALDGSFSTVAVAPDIDLFNLVALPGDLRFFGSAPGKLVVIRHRDMSLLGAIATSAPKKSA